MTQYHDPNSSLLVSRDFATPGGADGLIAAAHETLEHAAHFFDQNLPPGREKSTVKSKLEEALFWAKAALERQ